MILKTEIALLIIASILVISGCQHGPVTAPVITVGEKSRYHIVRSGDTLYSIAWRYDKDYKSLARVNKIAPPYTIFVGQKIAIRKRSETARITAAREKKARKLTRVKQTKAKQTGSAIATNSTVRWRWPMNGAILKNFDGKINKGIDIAGNPGARVNAAADGVVVYAGGNLRGYGKLVIVKHNDHFLSAYGNNREIRVREGEDVKAGQMLAEAGRGSSNAEMLHFEIRRDGKPKDPIGYLPKKDL
ncbi:MAG: peptidoglycan DD-metalloendopeptidase family protein [Gammaproteobacteria bacterium]|nr:peptidoglycan DD-metalloendopeptidase family protein [Gammaproteobacteria bacterium]